MNFESQNYLQYVQDNEKLKVLTNVTIKLICTGNEIT